MSLFGFYSLRSAWLAALLVPLVLFYFLKLKRPRVTVPSLVLWQRVLQDRRVNSPFQRFKRNILLMLQILVLTALVLSAMQPFFRGRDTRVIRIPVLIDCSASMAARDKPDGVTRLQAAQGKVEELIDNLLPDQELCLIAFAESARRLTGFTGNKRVLRDALASLKVQDVAGDLQEALRMAQALERSATFSEVLLLSDGNLPEQVDVELSFDLNYQKLAPGGPNAGIVSLNAKRARATVWDVFVRVEGSSETQIAAEVRLQRDGQQVAAERILVSRDDPERVVFRVDGARAADLAVTLVPDTSDSMSADNVAFLRLPAARPLRVHVAEGLGAYRHAFDALENAELVPDPAAEPDAPVDLAVAESETADVPAAPTRLYIGVVPADVRTLLNVVQDGDQIVDWRRTSALLQHVLLRDVVVLDQPRSADGVQESDFENAGYETLAYGQFGPLILRRRSGAALSYYMLFHTNRSTLPYRVGFPVLVSNIAAIAMQQSGIAEARAEPTGVLPALSLPPNTACTIRGPDSDVQDLVSDQHGVLTGAAAPLAGYYSIKAAGQSQLRIGASLLDATETRLTTTDEIMFREALSVTAATESVKSEKPLWASLGFLAFLVLLGEWWYYQRRSGG